MTVTLVDSNVLLDIATEDPKWSSWSEDALIDAADNGALAINPIIYAEVSVGFTTIEDLDDAIPPETFTRMRCPSKLVSWRARRFSTTAGEAAPS